MLGLIGARHLEWIQDNFERRGIESAWPPLRPNTIAGRRLGSSAPLQDTGRLRQSFVVRMLGNAVEVGSAMKIAAIHHEGSGSYVIRPRQARFLKFMTTAGEVFARSVRHPGIPRRRLIPSVGLGERLAIETADNAIKAVAT